MGGNGFNGWEVRQFNGSRLKEFCKTRSDATKRVPPLPKQAVFLGYWRATFYRGRHFIKFSRTLLNH